MRTYKEIVKNYILILSNHRAFPGEEGVTDGVGKEEAGPRAKVNPA